MPRKRDYRRVACDASPDEMKECACFEHRVKQGKFCKWAIERDFKPFCTRPFTKPMTKQEKKALEFAHQRTLKGDENRIDSKEG